MAAPFARTPPVWFWLVSLLLTAWEAMGIWAWWDQYDKGAYAMGATPTAYDLQYFAAIPAWYTALYALAVGSGLIGGLLLLAGRVAARGAFIVSLIATVAMFGYTFLATDLIAAKGVWVTYFPAVIIALGLFSVWWAGRAAKRGWLG